MTHHKYYMYIINNSIDEETKSHKTFGEPSFCLFPVPSFAT